MSDADVVALEESLENDLPVRLRLARARRVELLLLADEQRQALEVRLQCSFRLRNEHETVALHSVQRRKSVMLFVQSRETFGMRDMPQSSVQLVSPSVIGAHEGLRAAALRCDGHAAVPTDVLKSPHHAVLTTNGHDRPAGRFAGDVRTHIGERRGRTERSVRAPQHALHLRLEALLRAVVFHGLAPQHIASIRAAIGDV
jgi:hypothetical protein